MQNKNMNKKQWSKWRLFPDPLKKEFIHAPFGPGVYELRRKDTGEYILRGKGKNCAYRMASLLPSPYGQGTRNNQEKRRYIFHNLKQIIYRCCACLTNEEATALESNRKQESPCYFNA